MKKRQNARESAKKAGLHGAADMQSTARPTKQLPPEFQAGQPTRELAPIGPHPALPGRNARGEWAKDNDGHLETGVHSRKRWDGLRPMLQDERTRILRDKGFTEDDADRVFMHVVDGFNEAVVMMHSYFEFLMQTGGPISVKGRTRRAVEGWSRAADRVAKFASMLGLQKQPRRTPNVIESLLDETDLGANCPDVPEEEFAQILLLSAAHAGDEIVGALSSCSGHR